MRVLVAYASRYGSTREIAERIGELLGVTGHLAEVKAVDAVGELEAYDAFVIGSALYFGKWMADATGLVRRGGRTLAARPTWLFSSGPLGDSATDDQGRDLKTVSVPTELGELTALIHPREHRVFFGALDPRKLGLRDRLIRALPAGRGLLPEGDFRDWSDIERWSVGIARALAQLQPGPRRVAEIDAAPGIF